ncbi:MAG: hypothetical protein KatS3mg114_0345 [Planctomycetaceae bacterium]|nr:MAG: hypothetical protein KatS3mg114_0345 [Planctomycetaceae bacterium]
MYAMNCWVVLCGCLWSQGDANQLPQPARDPKRAAKPLLHWGGLNGVLQDHGLPLGWSIYPPKYEGYTCFTVPEPCATSPRSVWLQAERPWVSVIPARVPCELSQRYAARVLVRLSPQEAGEVLLRLDYLNAAGNTVASSEDRLLSRAEATDDWQLLAVEADPPAALEPTHIQMVVALRGGGKCYLDDFDFRAYRPTWGPSLLQNAGFEDWAATQAPYWSWQSAPEAQLSVQVDPRGAREGWHALYLRGTTPRTVLRSAAVPVSAGRSYQLRAWIRQSAGLGTLRLQAWQGEQPRQHVAQTLRRTVWREVTLTLTLPETEAPTHITAEYELQGECETWLDQFWLQPL